MLVFLSPLVVIAWLNRCVVILQQLQKKFENPNYWVEKLISKKKTRKFVLESMKDDLNVIDEKVGVVSK